MNIHVHVFKQKLKIPFDISNYVAGTQNFIRFVFDLSSDWDNLTVFAQFTQNNNSYNVYLDEKNRAYLPSEIQAGKCTLMLYGSGNSVRATTNYLTIKISDNILVSDITSTDITPALYEQLVDLVKSYGSGTLVAKTSSEMTDHSKVYIYIGSETGMVNGNWYYWGNTEQTWVSGGVYNALAVDTDTTLTVSGKAADAAAAGSIVEVGATQPTSTANKIWLNPTTDEIEIPEMSDLKNVEDKVDNLKSDLSDLVGVTLEKGVVKNQYVNNAGQINNYNGWDRTRYICVKGWEKLKVTSAEASNYNVFYDVNKTRIYATVSSMTVDITVGENEIIVPPNAYYAIFSGSAEYMENLSIEAIEKDYEYQDKKFRDYIQTDLYGKQVLVLGMNDLSVGYQLDSNGAVKTAEDRVAVTNDYYPLAHPHNKYAFRHSGYMVYVFEYSKDNSGTYNFIKFTTFTNGGTLWASTKTTHIRFYFKEANSYTLTPYAVADFCDKFQMREQNELNTYLRVCTFNQAADYPHFLRATEEELETRVHNYLNFIGAYNPDIICAQEAVGNYFQPVSYEKSTSAVFNRKYFYLYHPGYQRKMWSKYQYTDNAMITFQSQATGDSRFYGKETIHVDGKDIVIINTHCAYQGDSDFESVRKGQFEELVAEMQQHTYCVCCGDFNAWSASEFDVFKDAGFICANCGDYGIFDTWYVGTDYPDWPFKALDNIITSPNIVIQNVVRGPYDFTYFSDHAPLIADLQIR